MEPRSQLKSSLPQPCMPVPDTVLQMCPPSSVSPLLEALHRDTHERCAIQPLFCPSDPGSLLTLQPVCVGRLRGGGGSWQN